MDMRAHVHTAYFHVHTAYFHAHAHIVLIRLPDHTLWL